MRKICCACLLTASLTLPALPALADSYSDTVNLFKNAGASGGKKDATTAGEYQKGVAVFTIAKGGLMYEASVAGQKFSYKALPAN